MLQRAASNAYSWWWASHIRTKQSKWLEQSLQDMEEKVENVLKMIQEDGDSFAKRAEMYYKHRPELINFVEETVRAYRALAERYDKLSTELQNANTTIASVFPDQVPYDMDYDDDFGSGPPQMPKNQIPGPNAPKVPKIPKVPSKDLKGLLTTASKKIQAKKAFKAENHASHVPKSGLTKEEAIAEIDKLQKDILAMQTMKEFVKSSYESGLAKYWDIENKIMELQNRVCSLQDEFKVGKVIEDDDARTLMAEAALKSCEETLAKLEERQQKSSQDASFEHQKIVDAIQKLRNLKKDFLPNEADVEDKDGEGSKTLKQEKQREIEAKIKESFEGLSKKPLTVSELAETIDKLVNKVISLESSVSSQTALIDRLRTETDDLQVQIRNLEEDKVESLEGSNNMGKRLKEMEVKLHGVQDLDQNVENQNYSLKTHFTQARFSLEHLSEKLQNVKPDEEVEARGPSSKEEKPKSEEPVEVKEIPCTNDDGVKKPDTGKGASKETGKEAVMENGNDGSKSTGGNKKEEEVKEANKEPAAAPKTSGPQNEGKKITEVIDEVLKPASQEPEEEKEDGMNWQRMLLSGLEDKERILLKEYTTILRNYKDAKKKLTEEEKKNQGTLFELTVQVRELKTVVAKRDNEIQSLRQKLKLLQQAVGENKVENLEVPDDVPSAEKEDDDAKVISVDEPQTISPIEEKLRMEIDAILDENLDFWLRFSTAFHQVQKFKTEVEDLQEEIAKVKAKAKEGKTSTSMFTTDLRSEIRPIYKHLKEIQNELTVWLEQSASLKDELQRRCTSLTNIQEDITMALREGMEEEEIKFSTHQAAKFQGEILNMQQENAKVNEELQAGLDHVSALQLETDKTLGRLEEEFGLSDNQNQNPQLARSPSRAGIPLRSFIFGIKAKKQKPSIFACIHHHRKFGTSKGSIL